MTNFALRTTVALALAAGCLGSAGAQPAPTIDFKFIEGNIMFTGKSPLPMPAKEILARVAMRMPPSALGGRDITLTVPVRITMFFDIFAADDSLVSRIPVTIPVNLVLKPGDLGTLDIGWTGTALRVARNGTQVALLFQGLVGNETYMSMAVDYPMISFAAGNLKQNIVPLVSTTIFHEGGTPETIAAPRDFASGQ